VNTSNFTATTQLFLNHPDTIYWRFEVIFTSDSLISTGAIHFLINHPPENGLCSISPTHGTIDTLFTVACSNWSDADGIGGYSLFRWRENASDLVIFADSRDPTLKSFFPKNPENISLFHLLVFIGDRFDAVIELNVSSVSINSNPTTTAAFNETFIRLPPCE
jgi:hypothetical protein